MKITKVLICLLLVVLSFLSMSSFVANAVNATDWYWNKNVGSGNNCVTAHRAKEDDSSAYIYYTGGTKNPIQVRVCGSTYGTSYGGYDDGVNLTLQNMYNNYNNYYNVYTGTERGLQNTVNENHIDYAYLRITIGNSYLASGLWSPDSVGSYT